MRVGRTVLLAVFVITLGCSEVVEFTGGGDHNCQTGDRCTDDTVIIRSGQSFGLDCSQTRACKNASIIIESGCNVTSDNIDCTASKSCEIATIEVYSSDISSNGFIDCVKDFFDPCIGLKLYLYGDSEVALRCGTDACDGAEIFAFDTSTFVVESQSTETVYSLWIYDDASYVANGFHLNVTTESPTLNPTANPTYQTSIPSVTPSRSPTAIPSEVTFYPSSKPTIAPISEISPPTASPSADDSQGDLNDGGSGGGGNSNWLALVVGLSAVVIVAGCCCAAWLIYRKMKSDEEDALPNVAQLSHLPTNSDALEGIGNDKETNDQQRSMDRKTAEYGESDERPNVEEDRLVVIDTSGVRHGSEDVNNGASVASDGMQSPESQVQSPKPIFSDDERGDDSDSSDDESSLLQGMDTTQGRDLSDSDDEKAEVVGGY